MRLNHYQKKQILSERSQITELCSTRRSAHRIVNLRTEYAIVVLLGVERFVQEHRHTIGQHPQVAIEVDLQVIGEDERVRVGVDDALRLGRVRFATVPAAHAVLVHLRVEQHVRLVVVEFGRRLTVLAAIAEQLEVKVCVGAGGVCFVLQHQIRDDKLLVRGERMEVDGTGTENG